jgi:hypothetical protein
MIDQSVRVVTTLFALLIGLGLKHLLEEGDLLQDDKPAAFFLALFLFLRYLTGSANHLWHTYSNANIPAGKQKVWLLFDLGSLSLFGILAIRIAYADQSVEVFLFWNLAFLLFGMLWSLVSLVRSQDWLFWLVINSGQFLAVGIFYALIKEDGPSIPHIPCSTWMSEELRLCWSAEMAILVLLYACILVVDFWWQLKVGVKDLREPANLAPSNQ